MNQQMTLRSLLVITCILLGDQAFAGCSGLKEIHTMNAIPQKVKSTVFNGIDKKTCTLYVPKGSCSSYSRAEGWRDFATIIEED